MPLTDLKTILSAARRNSAAAGAFSVSNLEMIHGVIRAAEETGTPVILQVAECRLETNPLYLLAPAMLSAAKEATVPVCVHLDHGLTFDCIGEALSRGFTSVMYDGSKLTTDENIRGTLRVMETARKFGADAEAEIGRIGKSESGEDCKPECADPDECIRFIEKTGVTALAVAIGNAHGVYQGTPLLRFDILEKIREKTDTPLVLHGGTGLSANDFRACIALGVNKINIATATFSACRDAAQNAEDYFDMSRRMEQASYESAKRHIDLFGHFTLKQEKKA